uniref:Calponin-homology (CH) domain-containing protein n=1 Tax=Salarias fasciatus TaxID=181472 RepID=A0A672GK85_SALFA
MESGVFLPCVDQFMLSPLVTWVKTFVPGDGGAHLDFSELLDGVFLIDIMTQINPSAAPQSANKVSRDPSQRIHNLNFLIQQIKIYYLVSLKCFLCSGLNLRKGVMSEKTGQDWLRWVSNRHLRWVKSAEMPNPAFDK